MISKNVMMTNKFKDAIYYRASCSCGSKDHDTTIEFEIDEGLPKMIFLNFYKKIVWSSHWGDDLNIFQRLWKRLKCSFKIIFKGYIELEESFILSEDNIEPFIEALNEGNKFIKDKKVNYE